MVTFRALQERERLRELGDDNKYWRMMPFVFELRVKNDAFVYPLVLNPTRYSVSTPFTVRDTMTLFGGVVLEENGIVVRRISLAGTMGLNPKPVIGASFPYINNPAPSFKPRGSHAPTLMSGQRHLQFLEDRIFRTYGDLKKNPETSATTRLHFHSLKDGDSYLVAPLSLDIMRAVPRSTFSNYSIELLAVRMVDAVKLTPSPDSSLISQLQNLHDTVRSGYSALVGSVKDITRFVRDLESAVNGVASTLVAIASFGNTVVDFIDGAADAIAAPFNLITNTLGAIEESIERIIDSGANGSAHVVAAFNRAKDAVNMFSIHPSVFDATVTSLSFRGTSAASNGRRVSSGTTASAITLEELNEAAAETDPITTEQFGKLAILPGDLDRTRTQSFDSGVRAPIRALRTYVVKQGDTLPTIALRELGDATRWREIAYANRLAHPYISLTRLPGTVTAGDRIFVPVTDETAPTQVATLGIIGAKPTDPLDDRLYGRDLAFERDAQGQFDIPVDTVGGRDDAKLVHGVDCAVQAIDLRIAIERGHYSLYPSLGFIGLSGLHSTIETEMIELRVSETLLEDTRVRGVSSIIVSAPSADVRLVEADVLLVSKDQPVAIESDLITR